MKEFKRSPFGEDNHFEILKERFFIIQSALCSYRNASDNQKERVAEMVFTSDNLTKVEKLLDTSRWSRGKSYFKSWWYRTAKGDAHRTSDGNFLADLPILANNEPFLAPAAAQIEEHFTQKLGQRVHSLASRWANSVSQAELERFNQHQHLQATTLEDQDRMASRKTLLQDLRKVLSQDGTSQ
jgi:hypothetical protein